MFSFNNITKLIAVIVLFTKCLNYYFDPKDPKDDNHCFELNQKEYCIEKNLIKGLGFCLIKNKYYKDGEICPYNKIGFCNATQNHLEWSFTADSCEAGKLTLPYKWQFFYPRCDEPINDIDVIRAFVVHSWYDLPSMGTNRLSWFVCFTCLSILTLMLGIFLFFYIMPFYIVRCLNYQCLNKGISTPLLFLFVSAMVFLLDQFGYKLHPTHKEIAYGFVVLCYFSIPIYDIYL